MTNPATNPVMKPVMKPVMNRPANRTDRARRMLPALLLATALLPSPARADSDQDRARAAVQAGQVLPLKVVLERLEREHPGQVLEVELEQDEGAWLYEVKLLQAGGRLVKLKVDAASGELRQRQERRREHDGPN